MCTSCLSIVPLVELTISTTRESHIMICLLTSSPMQPRKLYKLCTRCLTFIYCTMSVRNTTPVYLPTFLPSRYTPTVCRQVTMGMRVLQLMSLMTVVATCVATPSGLGQECGDNPMKEILNVAKRTGMCRAVGPSMSGHYTI